MESSLTCKKCKKKALIRDEHGLLVCESCGSVQEVDDFQHHFCGVNDQIGTFIRVGSASHKDDYNSKQYKIYKSTQKIDEITSRLGLSSSTTAKVKQIMEDITQGELGDGNWFPIFTSACCYVVLRNNNTPFSMSEIANCIGCDLHELGRMVVRVIHFLDLNLPQFDIVLFFEKSIRNLQCFEDIAREKLNKMVKEGVLLLNCCVKWYLTTGRQPVPVVVAVLVFVAELNEVRSCIETIGKELHAGVDTCRKRYKELLESLVKVAQALPWGKNVTVQNVVKNAPMVIMYMEMKSKLDPGKGKPVCVTSGFVVEEAVNICIRGDADYADDDDCSAENESKYFENGDLSNLDVFDSSQACLSAVYTDFMNPSGYEKRVIEGGGHSRCNTKRKKDFGLQVCNRWRTGKSSLSKHLYFKEILEKNVGFNGLPPSFIAGELACKRRREKIAAAKRRIQKIMKPSSLIFGNENDETMVLDLSQKNMKKRELKTMTDVVDWEDNIIEILLLHQVKEEEIEQGHYNRLMDLYVFDSENTCEIFRRKTKKRL